MSKSKMMKIMVGGREYPCRATMGAMLRFKRETGREVTELDMSQMSDLAVWLWCCVLSACAADGVDFGMELMEFADQLSPDVMTAWPVRSLMSPPEIGRTGRMAMTAKKKRKHR